MGIGTVYLAALIVGLGILLVQVAMGSKDADGGGDAGGKDFGIKDFGGEHAAGKDFGGQHGEAGVGGLVSMFASTRFWIFAFFGFGFSGSLLHYVLASGFVATLTTALALGLFGGGGAALAHRAFVKAAAPPLAHTSSAAGKVGRVLVPIANGELGQVRIELRGATLDLRARTDGGPIERGDTVVVEEVEGEIAVVSRAPRELA